MSFYSYSRNQARIWVRITGIEEPYQINWNKNTKVFTICTSLQPKFGHSQSLSAYSVLTNFMDPEMYWYYFLILKVTKSPWAYSNVQTCSQGGFLPQTTNPCKTGLQNLPSKTLQELSLVQPQGTNLCMVEGRGSPSKLLAFNDDLHSKIQEKRTSQSQGFNWTGYPDTWIPGYHWIPHILTWIPGSLGSLDV